MTQDESLQIIRNAFSHIEVVDIVLGYDPLAEGVIAKVVVRDHELTKALRKNGRHARTAAMQSGIDVEVVTESETQQRT